MLGRQRENLEEELGETNRMWETARKSMTTPKKVGEQERDEALDQFKDLLKTLPASAILAGTFLIPIPGAQPILTPILMKKFGLFPSAWSKDSMERDLREVAALARQFGLPDLAAEVSELEGQVRALDHSVNGLRRFVKDHPDLRVFFDEDLDNQITERELRHLQGRVKDCAVTASASKGEKAWFAYVVAQCDTFPEAPGSEKVDRILGPLAFDDLRNRYGSCPHILVRHETSESWLPLIAVLKELQTP
jgi:hypothetical protein